MSTRGEGLRKCTGRSSVSEDVRHKKGETIVKEGGVPAPVVVVGAGAAGTMAAIFAAREGAPVVLLERTRDGGRKILISGGGRCNVLPSELNPARYVTESSPNTMKKMLLSWPLVEQRRFFEETLGIPLKLEAESGKMFPCSNRARDVRDGLLAHAREGGVDTRFEWLLTELSRNEEDGGWEVRSSQERIHAAAVILATGGLSVPQTGSDGTGLRIARKLGHELHPTYPALTPLVAEPNPHAALAGISLEVELRASTARGSRITRGGFLFTHRGYSGPSVLDISDVAVRSRTSGTVEPILARWTGMKAAEWETELRDAGRRTAASVVRRHLPDRLANQLLLEAGISDQETLSQLRREQRGRLIDVLTRYPLPWTGDEGYRKAEVTGGGVSLREVNTRSMESLRHPGLYICGEMLDAFGPIGGYNFAWAWSTGRAAGIAAGSRWLGMARAS